MSVGIDGLQQTAQRRGRRREYSQGFRGARDGREGLHLNVVQKCIPGGDVILLINIDESGAQLCRFADRSQSLAQHPRILGKLLHQFRRALAGHLVEHLARIETGNGLGQTLAALAREDLVESQPRRNIQPQCIGVVAGVVELQPAVHQPWNRCLANGAARLIDEPLIDGQHAQPVFIVEQAMKMPRQRIANVGLGSVGFLPLQIHQEAQLRLVEMLRLPQHQVGLEIFIELVRLRGIFNEPMLEPVGDFR